MILHDMNLYKNTKKQITNIYDTKISSSSLLQNAFDIHVKCIQIHSISALRALYSPQRYELMKTELLPMPASARSLLKYHRGSDSRLSHLTSNAVKALAMIPTFRISQLPSLTFLLLGTTCPVLYRSGFFTSFTLTVTSLYVYLYDFKLGKPEELNISITQ